MSRQVYLTIDISVTTVQEETPVSIRIQLSRATVKDLHRRLRDAYQHDDVRLVRRLTVLIDLLTPIHLWRLIGVSATAPKPDEDIGQEADDDHKDASADPQHQPRELEDGLSWRRSGIEDIGKVYRPIHIAYNTA